MRPLTDVEAQTVFNKMAQYTGQSLSHLISDSSTNPSSKKPDRHVFRISGGNRVYYVRESLANLATSVARHNLLSIGTCLGKFTKTGKFRLHITALDVIAPHARYKVWVRPNGEMPFLYGGHVVKVGNKKVKVDLDPIDLVNTGSCGEVERGLSRTPRHAHPDMWVYEANNL